jgi:hypothetical protein
VTAWEIGLACPLRKTRTRPGLADGKEKDPPQLAVGSFRSSGKERSRRREEGEGGSMKYIGIVRGHEGVPGAEGPREKKKIRKR